MPQRERCVVHFVGSVPLHDADSVFRTLCGAAGPYLARLPDGETGIRRRWIRFLQDVLAAHPAIEVAADVPAFRFVQWDGALVREIPRLRVIDPDALAPERFRTGYAEMAVTSWRVFERLRRAGVIPDGVRFQISLPTPTAPTYNNMLPADRPAVLEALTRHMIGEVEAIAAAIPKERIALQWDVCQEVLAWEGYYEPGPVDFRTETLAVLARICDAVPEPIELGLHLCYGSPADEHLVQPADAGLMVEIANATAARVARPIDYVHLPVPRARTDDTYFTPLARLALDAGTFVYLGLVHHDDAAGDAARLETARRYTRVDGVAAECGMGRGDPSRLDGLLAAHVAAAELQSEWAARDADRVRTQASTDDLFRDNDAEAAPETPFGHEEPLAAAPAEPAPAATLPEPVTAAAPVEPVDDATAHSTNGDDAEPATPAETLSPSVRRLVKQYGLDVSGLRGTGPGGRIRVGDVMALLGGRDAPADDAGPRPGAREGREPGKPPPEPEAQAAATPDARVAEASATSAEAVTTTVFECDVGRILEDQRRRREQGRETALSAYFVAGLARALRDTQAFAAESGHRIPRLGLETPGGTHVLTDAETLTVEQITVALRAPVVACEKPQVLIRHHGPAGSLLVQSDRLAPKQLAVLGIGRIRRQVVVRRVDGAEAARIASQCLLSLSLRSGTPGLQTANALLARSIAYLERWRVLGERSE